ncbi:hypothetical protein E3G68_005180 [Mycobacteroides abscessus]|uniref:hypothetical protein n=1 Tax=Mycobacteroides abscessus TaxID=36809 RepID=UPI0018784B1A|nr:hypothetical protein [Mycobacteroides abscessus]
MTTPSGKGVGFFKQWFTFSRPTGVLLCWLAGLLVVGAILFSLVAWACGHGPGIAFDVLTQHLSPTQTTPVDVGVSGWLLSCFGYFVVPAAIGALVGAVYLNSTKVTQRHVSAVRADIEKGMQLQNQNQNPPPQNPAS